MARIGGLGLSEAVTPVGGNGFNLVIHLDNGRAGNEGRTITIEGGGAGNMGANAGGGPSLLDALGDPDA
jgi:hypothetical protein